MGECLYKTFIICLKNFNEFFLCIYLGEGKGGGFTNTCIYMGTHSLSYRTDLWMLTKPVRDEVIMILHICLGFTARSAKGWSRAAQK